MTVLPTRENLMALDNKAWADFVELYVEVSIARYGAALAAEVRRRVAEDDELRGEVGDAKPVKAVFSSWDYDNGWFYDESQVMLVFPDGVEDVDYELNDAKGDLVSVRELLADLSTFDAVGPKSTMTLDLSDGSVEFDTYGNS